jgi:hypothetical protein
MPRRKKTRTRFTDLPAHPGEFDAALPRSARKMQQLRRDIAAEAARIMATESQRNFRLAKQKAAARIGVNSRLALPSNQEIEDALRSYQGFFGGEHHDLQVQELRSTALRVMRGLEAFNPRLVGPVLEGTADRYSRISLHVFNDPAEAVAMELSERGLEYRQEERTIRWHDGSHRRISLLVTEADGRSVELALFRSKDLRQAPPCPVSGLPQKRAPIAEVECLLAGMGAQD